MKKTTKRIVIRAFLIYTLVSIFTYALYHIAYLFTNDALGLTFEYIAYYVSNAVDFLTPPIMATVMLVLSAREGAKKAFLHTLLISTARIYYTLPYYYLIFIYNYNYDSIESILISFAVSVVAIVIVALGALISFVIATFILGKRMKKRYSEIISSLPKIVKEPSTLDFLNTASIHLLVFTLLRFAISLIGELTDTVIFFVEYGSDYTLAEIGTMLGNYVLLFILLVVSYLVCAKVKNLLARCEEDEDETATDI